MQRTVVAQSFCSRTEANQENLTSIDRTPSTKIDSFMFQSMGRCMNTWFGWTGLCERERAKDLIR
jgi:hypothetical protein